MSSRDMNLEKALAKITEEMGIFHDRLEKVKEHLPPLVRELGLPPPGDK